MNGDNRPTITDVQRSPNGSPLISALSDTSNILPVNNEAQLDQDTVHVDTVPPPPNAPSWKRGIGFGLIALGILAGSILIVRTNYHKTVAASLTDASTRIKQQTLTLPNVSKQLSQSNAQNLNTVTVNGQLAVSNSLNLQPSAKPSNATRGQLYYDQTRNQLGVYDGKQYVYLQGGGNASIINNYSTSVGGAVTNNFLTTGGGGLTGSGMAGTLPVFGNGNTLQDSVISQAGTTLNVGLGNGSGTTNILGGTGGITVKSGVATGTSGSIVIASGNSSATAAGDVTVDTGQGKISGQIIDDYTFENSNDVNAFTDFYIGSFTLSQDCTVAHTGNCSLNVTGSDPFGGGGDVETQQNTPFTVVPGHHYAFSLWVRAATTPAPLIAALWNWPNCGIPFEQQQDSASQWTNVVWTCTAPAGLTESLMQFGFGSASTETHYYDDINITDLSSSTSAAWLKLGTTNAQAITLGNANEIGQTSIYGGSGITLNSDSGSVNISGGAFNITSSSASNISTSSGALTLGGGGGSGGGVIVAPDGASTTAFQVQGTNNTNLLTVDSTDNAVSFGTGVGPTVGDTGIGTTTGGSGVNTLSAQKITTTTAPAGQTTVKLTALSAFIGADGIEATPDNEYQFAIYADNGSGAPGAYVASTEVGTLGTAAGWYSLPINVALNPSTTYWLVYWQNGITGSANGYSVTPGVPGAVNLTGAFAWGTGPDNGLPAAFPSGGSSTTDDASIYATYSGGGPALTLNSAGTLTQSGAAIFQDSINSSTAFLIQNNAGSSLFTADTADMLITVDGSLTVTGNLTVQGEINANSNVRGVNVAVPSSATSVNITFGTAYPDANYAVLCTPNFNSTCYATNKLTTGFTLHFGTAAPNNGSGTVDWMAVH